MRDRKPWWQTQSRWDDHMQVEASRKEMHDKFEDSMRNLHESIIAGQLAEKQKSEFKSRAFAEGTTSGIGGLDVADEIRSGTITFNNGETTVLTDREKMLMASVVITLRTS